MFGDTEVKKSGFHKSKCPIDINKVNIGKIMISNEVSYGKKGFKCFVEYSDDNKTKPLCIMLPKMIGYVKHFGETKYMSFLIEDEELLKEYKNKVRDKISSIM